MARTRPFRRIEIDAEICSKVERVMKEIRYRGSFTSFVESTLERFADGMLVEADGAKIVHAVGVRRQANEQQRKTS